MIPTETLMIAATAIDLLAVGALVWLVRRSGRAHDAAMDDQRAVLARLREELAELVQDAERRARTLDEALAAREAGLRAILVAVERAGEAGTRAAAARGADPAEARLLRDLELHFRPRTA